MGTLQELCRGKGGVTYTASMQCSIAILDLLIDWDDTGHPARTGMDVSEDAQGQSVKTWGVPEVHIG